MCNGTNHNHDHADHDHDDYVDDEVSEMTPAEQEKFLAAHPGLSAIMDLFEYLNVSDEERDAGVAPAKADIYLRAYGFHPARLEEKRAAVRDLITSNVASDKFFSDGAAAIYLIREPGGLDLFSTPESTDAFLAVAVALGFASVQIPSNMPPKLALILAKDTVRFNLTPGVEVIAA